MVVHHRWALIIFIAATLAVLLSIAPDRGAFPSSADMIALERARESGADLTEWRWLARFVDEHPRNSKTWERMGILDYRDGLCTQAVFEFDQATTYGKLSPDSLIPLSSCLIKLGRYPEAVNELTPVLGSSDAPPGLEPLLARAYLKQGAYDRALLTLKTWSYAAVSPQSMYALGIYQALTQPSESLKNLQSAAALQPKYDAAYREIQKAVNTAGLNPDQAYQAVVIGQAYGNLDEWELAEYAFQSALKENPGYAEAHAWLGETQQHLGMDGTDELALALELNPDSILAQALNAILLERQGKPEGAVIYLEQISQQEPENPAWQMALGQAYAQLGMLPEAGSHYQKAVTLEPANVSAWQALAEFCFAYQFNVQTTGSTAAEQALQLAPDSPRSLDLAGQSALNSGDTEKAQEYMRKAIEKDPQYAPAHLHLALVLLQLGRIPEAKQELEKAGSLGNIEAESLLRQIQSP